MTAVAVPRANRAFDRNLKLKLLPHEGYALVLNEVAKGQSVKGAIRRLRRKGVRTPSPARFFEWGVQTPERYDLFARAIEVKTELQIDELDDLINGVFYDEDGNRVTDPAMIAVLLKAAEAKVKLRQWRASKAMPKRYGDKLHHEHSGGVAIAVVTGVANNVVSDAPVSVIENIKDVPHRVIETCVTLDSDDDDWSLPSARVARVEVASVAPVEATSTTRVAVTRSTAMDFE